MAVAHRLQATAIRVAMRTHGEDAVLTPATADGLSSDTYNVRVLVIRRKARHADGGRRQHATAYIQTPASSGVGVQVKRGDRIAVPMLRALDANADQARVAGTPVRAYGFTQVRLEW